MNPNTELRNTHNSGKTNGLARRFHRLAVTAQNEGRQEQAKALLLTSLHILERAKNSERDLAAVLNSLARLHEARCVYGVAERWYQRAIKILKSGDGSTGPKLHVWSLANLANLYRIRGRYQEAETLFREALAMAERILKPDDLTFSALLNNLAVLYKYMGRFSEACRLYMRALTITERTLGPE